MFENIGKKIKTLAEILCWIGVISSVIGGIVLVAKGASLSDGGTPMIIIGIATIIIGPLLSWISNFVLYGFGEHIDDTKKVTELEKDVLNQTYNIAQSLYASAQKESAK